MVHIHQFFGDEVLKKLRCDYCDTKFEDKADSSEWSEFHKQHYKVLKCTKCGKKHSFKVGFSGSGHDRDLKFSPLESTVNKVRSK